ncbi:ABC transporter ATP-binding protein [Roseomonas fluvialis]|uniref:Nitrate/sulfonate/bicarbonate ABC transporter ATP-binding protein n=1 Tax=Roseomonas fluvialis TaxID=1750527 RepID=A0ABN6PAP8_9PROT|nr:ABC transporter ATP-binding protein [Roseomonas fluvialis]BDG75186.1 nitrate/sulfonate/bicarbonate ABC transporter ATP-binding protein [Roseomonas fluvialis]
MTQARPLVALRGVTKRYRTGTLALNGIDLSIRQGEFVALLGASGCGKSTLLRILAGLSAPSSGSIDWPQAAHDASGDPLRDIGFVFQEPTLMPWATVMRNVTLPLELAGVNRTEAEDRAAEWLARVELKGFEKAYPRALSGGMRMRVSIARALVTRPRLLLMDEPFAALDEITRFRLNNDLLQLWAADRFTVVFVTHSVFESVFLAERIVVMAPRPGRIAEEVAVAVEGARDEAFRTSALYADHCRTVSAALSATINPAERPA